MVHECLLFAGHRLQAFEQGEAGDIVPGHASFSKHKWLVVGGFRLAPCKVISG